MSKLFSSFRPELLRLLVSSCPARRHTAWWHFKKTHQLQSLNEKKRALRYSDLVHTWKTMNPEEKRKYFSLAEYDLLRYKEQQKLWIARVCSLIERYSDQIHQLESDLIRKTEKLSTNDSKSSTRAALNAKDQVELSNNEIKKSNLERYKENYEILIQCETTRNLYKNLFSEIDKINQESMRDDSHLIDDIVKRAALNPILSRVPKELRAVLTAPRRPPTPFTLFFLGQLEKFKLENDNENSKHKKYNQAIASEEWAKLPDNMKEKYREKYRKEMEDYQRAKAEFEKRQSTLSDDNKVAPNLNQKSRVFSSSEDLSLSILHSARKERSHYSRSVRRKLRKLQVPISVRNAFNFYLMENKESFCLNEAGDESSSDEIRKKSLAYFGEKWRKLSDEEKAPYYKLQEEDRKRYEREKKEWEEKRNSLAELLQLSDNKKSSKM